MCKSSPFTIASEHAPRLSVVKEEGLENFSPAPAEGDVMTNADGVLGQRDLPAEEGEEISDSVHIATD